jgi:hypothetical protein
MNLIPATNSIIVIIDENWEETLTKPTFLQIHLPPQWDAAVMA